MSQPITKQATRISLVYTSDRAQGVRRAITLLQFNPVQGKTTVIKPNFNSADPPPASTHNDTLRSLILTLKEMGASHITIAERSGPGDSTRTVMEKKGIFDIAAELGATVINLDEIGAEDWVHIKPEGSHWGNGFHFPRIYHDAESVVQTCCLKTHAFGGDITLSLKNAVGLVPRIGYPYMRELHSSPYQRQMIAEINTAYSPDLIVLDGVEAFIDGGPARGTKVEANVIVAGNDRIAIDMVGVAVLRLLGTTTKVNSGKITQLEQISRAIELQLGISSPEQIIFTTDDSASFDMANRIKNVLLK